MDVILALQAFVKREEDREMTFHHVKGHMDVKKGKGELKKIEVQNVECDNGAEESVNETR